MIKKINTIYIVICWIPLVVLFCALNHIKSLKGWSALAAGYAIKKPVVISLILGIIGLMLIIISSKINKISYTLIIATILAATPFLWFLIVFYLSGIF